MSANAQQHIPGKTARKARGGLLLARGFYFLYYAAMASLVPFLVLYYEECGLRGHQIGILAAIPPVLVLVGASLWGAAADFAQRHKLVLLLALIGTGSSAALLGRVTAFGALVPVVIAFALFMAPIPSLADNTILDLLADQRHRYGRIRLWGAVGWGTAAPLIGRWVEVAGLRVGFHAFVLLLACCLVTVLWLPVASRPLQSPLQRGLRQLLASPAWGFFLLLAFVGGLGLGFAHHYLFLYMDSIGASRSLMGLALSAATISELVFFYTADRFLQRWGVQKVLLAAIFTVGARLLLYAVIDQPRLVLAVQLLHGPSFALMWTSGVAWAHRLAPPGLGATAQGVFAGVNFGLAGGTGALIGGLLLDRMDTRDMYACAGAGVLVLVTLLVLAAPRGYFPAETQGS